MAIVMRIHPRVCLFSFFKHFFSLSVKMSSPPKKKKNPTGQTLLLAVQILKPTEAM